MGGNNGKAKSSQANNSVIKANIPPVLVPDKPKEIIYNIDILKNAFEVLTKLHNSSNKAINDEEETKNLNFVKDIDLVEVLDAIVYNVEINNNLWDVKEIIKNIQIGFDKLMCTQSHWDNKAIMCLKYDDDSPAELYWDIHSKAVYLAREGKIELKNELDEDIYILESLEKLLIILQEQMKYLEIERENIDIVTYKKVKSQIDKEYDSLSNTLNEMTNKAKQAITSEVKTNMIPRYEPLSFVKISSDKWVESIFQILKFIFEANMKSEIELKLRTIKK